MKYIPPETLQEVKQIDLLTYLNRYEPFELVRVSNEVYSTKTHDSIRISNGMWHRFSTGDAGKSALDYLIKVKNMAFMEAAHHILSKSPAPIVNNIIPAKKERRLLLPKRSESCDKAIAYLRKRCIDKSILADFINTNSIYETQFHNKKNGKTYDNIVFIGFDDSDIPRYANIRGIDTNYKGEASGSDKHYSFRSITKNDSANSVHIFESAIDLLSCATHLKMMNMDYKSYNLLSLAGVYMPKKNIAESKVPATLDKYLNENSHIKNIVLHLDKDYPGQIATIALQTILKNDYQVLNSPPQFGKDYNDYLSNLLHNQQERER